MTKTETKFHLSGIEFSDLTKKIFVQELDANNLIERLKKPKNGMLNLRSI